MTTIDATEFPIDATGDACVGDEILFNEAVFSGSFRNAKYLGDRRIAARIVKDSYGADKQQHTFSLVVIASDGVEPLAAGATTRRKGRNIYRHHTLRKRWTDEASRKAALADKHARGSAARSARDARRAEGWL